MTPKRFRGWEKLDGLNTYCTIIDELHRFNLEEKNMNNCKQRFSMNTAMCARCHNYGKCAYERHKAELDMFKNFLNGISWNVTDIEIENPCAGLHPDTTIYVEGHPNPFYPCPTMSMSLDTMRELIYHHLNGLPMQCATHPEIKNVIFNPPATIVFWGDGTKTVVKCQDDEEYDPEKGITMAFFKKMHGNKGRYFEEIKKWTHKYIMSLFKDEVHEMTDETIVNAVEAGMSEAPSGYVLFYARADRSEDEGYIRHPVVYKHKSSAVRAAKKLIAKLPNGVEYTWFVDTVYERNE